MLDNFYCKVSEHFCCYMFVLFLLIQTELWSRLLGTQGYFLLQNVRNASTVTFKKRSSKFYNYKDF